jgi:hypothetical protein
MAPQETATRIHLIAAAVWLVAGFLIAGKFNYDLAGTLSSWRFFIGLAFLHVVAGVICTRWLGIGKAITVLLAALQVLVVPIGTIVAALLLWASVKEWSWPKPSRAGELAKSWPQT